MELFQELKQKSQENFLKIDLNKNEKYNLSKFVEYMSTYSIKCIN